MSQREEGDMYRSRTHSVRICRSLNHNQNDGSCGVCVEYEVFLCVTTGTRNANEKEVKHSMNESRESRSWRTKARG